MDETLNPYATPQSDPEREPVRSETFIAGKGTFDIGQSLRDGWNNTIRNFGPVLAVMLLGGVLSMVSYFTCIGIFLVLPVLVWGISKFLLNTHDGRCDFNDLFAGFRNYGPVLGQSLLLLVLLFLLSVIGSSVQYIGLFSGNEDVANLGTAISLLWSVLVMIRFYWAWFFLVDQSSDAVTSLKSSWQATSGNWFKLIGLALLSFVISLLGMLALIIGIFVAIPVVYLMFTSAYRQAVGTPALASTEFE